MDEPSTLLKRASDDSRGRVRRDQNAAPKAVRPLLAYVEKHLFEPSLNVNRLRELFGSPDNPVHQLRTVLRASPHAYIEDRRLETACRLLADTRLRVGEIAALLGYSSIQVFSRAFFRWAGQRPTAYRRQGRQAPLRVQPPAAEMLARVLTRIVPTMSDPEIARIQTEEIWSNLCDLPPSEQGRLVGRLRLGNDRLVRRLCAESRRCVVEQPDESERLARLGVLAADRSDPEIASRLRAECWAELANAHREMGQLQQAAQAIAIAEAWSGEIAPPLEVRTRVLAVKANLLRDQRRFREARDTIDEALALAQTADRSLFAELLLNKGTILAHAGNPSGIAMIEEAAAFLQDREKET